MTEETNSEVAEALEAVGEKTGGEVAVEAAEAAQATEEVSEVTEEFAQEQLEEMGLEDKPADTESERHRLRAMIEAAVYVSEEPLTIQQLTQALSQPKDVVEGLLNELLEAYAAPHHGIAVREV